MPSKYISPARRRMRSTAPARPSCSIVRVSENTSDTPTMNTNIGKIRSSKWNPAQLAWLQLPGQSLNHRPSLNFRNAPTSASAPTIQNMSKPRNASSDIRRRGFAAALTALADGEVGVLVMGFCCCIWMRGQWAGENKPLVAGGAYFL